VDEGTNDEGLLAVFSYLLTDPLITVFFFDLRYQEGFYRGPVLGFMGNDG